MVKKIWKAIRKGTLFNSIKVRTRFVLRIKNRNVYSEYLKCKEYERLEKKYNKIIKNGIDEKLPRIKSNKIWICWLQGIENAPEIVKACINSVKKTMKNKELIIITSNNINEYIHLPNYIEKKVKLGIIPFAQYTDIIRTALLCKYGGGWIDSTVLCTAAEIPDYIEESSLFVYHQMDLYSYKKDLTPINLSNWLIFSESNNPILLLTLKLLYKYWEDNNSLTNYFIYHLFFTIASRRYKEIWDNVPVFNNHGPHTLQQEIMKEYSKKRWNQLITISDFHKLNRRQDYSNIPNSFYNFILKEYLDENEKWREK